jgi:hypothetical protein
MMSFIGAISIEQRHKKSFAFDGAKFRVVEISQSSCRGFGNKIS